MEKIAQFCMLAWGWRRGVVCLVAGAILALSQAPFGLWPTIFIAFPLFIWVLSGCLTKNVRGRTVWLGASFWAGWWFGFGYFLCSLYWIGDALLVEGAGTLWVWPFAVIGLPAGLALFWAIAARLVKILSPQSHVSVVAFALCFALAEWLRGHIFTGFPWNLVGYAVAQDSYLMQSASLVGVYGLTFFVFLMGVTPAKIWPGEQARLGRRILPLVVALLLLGVSWGWGGLRYQFTELAEIDDVKLRLYQPNFTQEQRADEGMVDAIFNTYLTQSAGPVPQTDNANDEAAPDDLARESITHLIWPESAFNFYLAEAPNALAQIAQLLPQGTQLITGAARRDLDLVAQNGDTPPFNSILVIDDEGGISDFYDKTHLVPFGEYIPFVDKLPFLRDKNIANAHGTFLPGAQRRLITPTNAPAFLPLICYEIIFSGQLMPQGQKPEWLVNLSDDSWYNNRAGPAQHFLKARLRAVEHGLSMVRVSYGGISGVVDPLGRVRAKLEFDQSGVVDTQIYHALEPTLFTHLGGWLFWVLLSLSLLWVVFTKKIKQSN